MPKGDEISRPRKKKRKDPFSNFGTQGQAVALLRFARECRSGDYQEAHLNPDREKRSAH